MAVADPLPAKSSPPLKDSKDPSTSASTIKLSIPISAPLKNLPSKPVFNSKKPASYVVGADAAFETFVGDIKVSNPLALDAGQKPSFSDIVRSQKFTTDSDLPRGPETFVLKPTTFFQGRPAVTFPYAEKKALVDKLSLVLVGKFSHGRPSIKIINDFLSGLKLKGHVNASFHGKKHVFLECCCNSDYYYLWLRLVWKIGGYAMRVFKWTHDFSPSREGSIAPVWIRIEGLPLYMFDIKSLLSISNSIGKPIQVDPMNVNRSNLCSARICVELDVAKPLVDSIWLQFEDENSREIQEEILVQVFYDVVPLYCTYCSHLGHFELNCKRREEAVAGLLGAVEGAILDSTCSKNITQQMKDERICTASQLGATEGCLLGTKCSRDRAQQGHFGRENNTVCKRSFEQATSQGSNRGNTSMVCENMVCEAQEGHIETNAGAVDTADCQNESGPQKQFLQQHTNIQDSAATFAAETVTEDAAYRAGFAESAGHAFTAGAVGTGLTAGADGESSAKTAETKAGGFEAEMIKNDMLATGTDLNPSMLVDGCVNRLKQGGLGGADEVTVLLDKQAKTNSWADIAEQPEEEAVEPSVGQKVMESGAGTKQTSTAAASEVAEGASEPTNRQVAATETVVQEVPLPQKESEPNGTNSAEKKQRTLGRAGIEVFAKKEIEMIMSTPTKVAPVIEVDTHSFDNPYIKDKEGSPVLCSEIIRKSARLADVRKHFQFLQDENLIASLKEQGKYDEFIKSVMKEYTREIHLTFLAHTKSIYPQDSITDKATPQSQEVITNGSAVNEPEWTSAKRKG